MEWQIEKEKRMQFLWAAAHNYALECPQLAAHLMVRFAAMESKSIGLTYGVRQCFCPRCGSLFTPNTSSGKVRRRRGKRRRRKEEWLHKPLGKCKSYVVVHCKVCSKSFRTSCGMCPQDHQDHKVPGGQATPSVSSLHTPRSKPARSASNKRRSSTLKVVLQKSAREKQLMLQEATTSPRLKQFLTELK